MTNIASKRLLSDTFKSIYVPIVSSASSTLDIQAGIKLKLIPSSLSSISRRRSLALLRAYMAPLEVDGIIQFAL
jgi:hypothetical protein